MKTYDWIVVGGGITGAALSYELARVGFSVLLLEQHSSIIGATRYSYGGLAYWSGTTTLTRQLCEAGIARHRVLSEELEIDTQLRELDLLLTIAADRDPEIVAASYTRYAISPRLLDVAEACALEPLLDRNAIAGALTVKHGHIQPEIVTQGYTQAFLRAGGVIQIAQVTGFIQEKERITGVRTTTEAYHSNHVVVCAGGWSRALLKSAGIPVKLYFTHAEIIETPPVDLQLQTLVMPAQLQRFELEAESTINDSCWDQLGNQPAPPILDAGAIQFLDGSLRLGQLSRVLTDSNAKVNSSESEAALRSGIGQVLPALKDLPGTWQHCLVSFSSDRLPLIGAIPHIAGVYVFSGFSNPLVIIPPLAQRFANWAAGQADEIIAQLAPTRIKDKG